MTITCLFCEEDVSSNGAEQFSSSNTMYMCPRCGFVHLTREAFEDFNETDFKKEDRIAISITIRNKWEKSKNLKKTLTYTDLLKIKKQFSHLDPIEKLNNALLVISDKSKWVGDVVNINHKTDYPLYFCINSRELISVIKLLISEGLIHTPVKQDLNSLQITTNGYRKIRDLRKCNRESNQCFVAMWFTDEMNCIYEKSFKKAIEFVELGQAEPRFKAVKIDNVEHANDINDEIIAQIRRSRFMVCDLTGYRGGVYFEAGFAYGLGLDVIYTCRDDWAKEEYLKDDSGKDIRSLFDSNGNTIEIKKEGVHFDLAHRNRIEWSSGKVEEFVEKLTNRIKAIIY